jgi:very-short-patch-repair endonuclease
VFPSKKSINFFGTRFRRQHPIGPFVLDFYCAAIKLAVEVDGAARDVDSQAIRDLERNAWLKARGIQILRFNALDVLDEHKRQDVLSTIAAAAAPSTASGGPRPPLRG